MPSRNSMHPYIPHNHPHTKPSPRSCRGCWKAARPASPNFSDRKNPNLAGRLSVAKPPDSIPPHSPFPAGNHPAANIDDSYRKHPQHPPLSGGFATLNTPATQRLSLTGNPSPLKSENFLSSPRSCRVAWKGDRPTPPTASGL